MTDSQKLDLILSKFGEFNDRLDNIENRLDNIENRLDNIENRLDNMENRLDKVEDSNQRLQKDMTEIKLHLENVTDKNISILAENHLNLIDKLNQAVKVSDKNLIFEVRVNMLASKVDELEKEVAELKARTA